MHSVRRRNDQTARISLHHPSMSKSAETKINRAHHSHGATDQYRLQNFRRVPFHLLSLPVRFATVAVFSASVRGIYGRTPQPARGKRQAYDIFFTTHEPSSKCSGLRNFHHKSPPLGDRKHADRAPRRRPCRLGRAARASAGLPTPRPPEHKAPVLPTRP